MGNTHHRGKGTHTMTEGGKKVDEAYKRRAAEEKAEADKDLKAGDILLGAASLMNLIAGLGSQALIHMGAIAEPGKGEPEVNLPAAKYTIDLLGALEEKTKGNLSEEEKRHLEGMLYELRMRYVSVAGG